MSLDENQAASRWRWSQNDVVPVTILLARYGRERYNAAIDAAAEACNGDCAVFDGNQKCHEDIKRRILALKKGGTQ